MPKKIASPETIQARFDCPWDEVVRLADRHTRGSKLAVDARASGRTF
jgi:hypothetical protein